MAGALGWVELPAGLTVLQHPALLGASGFMLFVEFFADKIPGLDTLWDLVHTLVRIPAGAVPAAALPVALVHRVSGWFQPGEPAA